ncbi:MAG: 2-keto-4-pentenoate hydratase, partial [Gammaproteobacteria bacterium]|nr:2-keto-4-pentenoate hydratase [Gammaproteobacteria bacterium]
MTDDDLQRAADALLAAYGSGTPCQPVREMLPEAGMDHAYAIQNINTRRWLGEGRRLVGRKIGLTSRVVQDQLGVDQPDYGMLFADMCVPDGAEVPHGALLQAKVEAEVALVLERNLPNAHNTVADIISATAYALPAIEIVDSRIRDWNIRIVDTIADNASSGLYVLGCDPKPLAGLDLRHCGMVLECRGEQVSVSAGVACLGHPLNAAVWLADVM